MKKIKKYVDFNFKRPNQLGRKNKVLISRAYSELAEILTNNPHVIKSKSAKALKLAKEKFNPEFFSGSVNKHIKAVFLPPQTPVGTKIRMKGTDAVLESRYRKEQMFEFDPPAFVRNPQTEIDRVLKNADEYDRFFIRQGDLISDASYTRKTIFDKIIQLINSYSGDKPNSGKGMNHHFSKWILGIKGVKTLNQSIPKGRKRRGGKGSGNRRAKGNRAGRRA